MVTMAVLCCADLHLDIMNITVLAERRCKGLFDIILSDIVAKGAYGFDVSGYSFSMELSSLHCTPLRHIHVSCSF